jgi:hypothetical protein
MELTRTITSTDEEQKVLRAEDARENRIAFRLAGVGLALAITSVAACYINERGTNPLASSQNSASNVRFMPF